MKQKIFITLSVTLSILATRADAQEKVLIDNDKVKITEYISQPGMDVCGPGKHSHKGHVTILLTDANVKTVKDDGSIENETYSSARRQYTVTRNGKTEQIPTDGTFWAEGATHSVINTGNLPIKLLIVEMRQ